MSYVDTTLNLAWAIVCMGAFGWFIGFERLRASGARRAITYRAVAIGLSLVSLFPCVSASDDSMRLQFFGAVATPADSQKQHPAPAHSQPDKKTLGTLVRLLEALDSVQIGISLVLSVMLCLFALALIETHKSLDRFIPTHAGRGPPSLPVS